MSSLIAIAIFLVMFCIMVAVHELGHYWVGRKFGVGVHEFAIGFGRPILWTWKRKRFQLPDGEPATTDFNLRAFPLGGFVRFHGQEPLEDGSETKVNGGLYSVSPGKRWLILLAGPMASIIFGIFVLVGQLSLIGRYVDSTQINEIVKNKAAHSAGLLPGDVIVSVGPVPTVKSIDVLTQIRSQGAVGPIDMKVLRDGKEQVFTLKPTMSPEPKAILDKDGEPTGKMEPVPEVGFAFGAKLERVPFGEALVGAVTLPFEMAKKLASNLMQPKVLVQESRGVIGMVQETHTILERQALTVIMWCGAISISLGIMNLLPIGMLDGGQMVIAMVEMLRGGRRLSYNIQMRFLTVGTLIVIAFMVFINGRDLVRLVAPAETTAPKVENKR